MRHTFISVGLTNGVKIKWLADYCGTSVAIIEKALREVPWWRQRRAVEHPFWAKSETLSETLEAEEELKQGQVAGMSSKGVKWAHLDSNQGPTGYEPVALTN